MKDIAIYYNKGKSYITVFTFSDEAFAAFNEAIELAKIKVKGPPRKGSKPGSYKFAVYCNKETVNMALEGKIHHHN